MKDNSDEANREPVFAALYVGARSTGAFTIEIVWLRGLVAS